MNLKAGGFTLIEVILVIVVLSLLMSTFLMSAQTLLVKTPVIDNQKVAIETARACMEWFLQQRNLKGYSTFSCPSTPTATNCSAPAGFSVTTNITCTTWNADTNYETLTVSISGLATLNLTTMLGSY